MDAKTEKKVEILVRYPNKMEYEKPRGASGNFTTFVYHHLQHQVENLRHERFCKCRNLEACANKEIGRNKRYPKFHEKGRNAPNETDIAHLP